MHCVVHLPYSSGHPSSFKEMNEDGRWFNNTQRSHENRQEDFLGKHSRASASGKQYKSVQCCRQNPKSVIPSQTRVLPLKGEDITPCNGLGRSPCSSGEHHSLHTETPAAQLAAGTCPPQVLLEGVHVCSPINNYLQVHHKLTGHCRVSQFNIYHCSARVLLQKHFLRLLHSAPNLTRKGTRQPSSHNQLIPTEVSVF